MAYDTRELAVKITGDASEFVKASSEVKGGSEDAKSSLEKFSDGAKKAAIGLGAVGVGLTAYAKNATDYTVGLVKSSKELSRETGVSVEQASQYVYVAQRMGISADQASTVFGKFSKSITKATEEAQNAGQAHQVLQNQIDTTKLEIQKTTDEIKKNGDKTGELSLKLRTLKTDLQGQETQLTANSNSFQKLGINVLDAQGKQKGFNDLLLETADKFKAMPDGVDKTTIAMSLFGRSGKDMIPILNRGSQGIEDLEKNADKLGLTLNAKTINSVSKYIQSQKDLTDSTNALKVQIGNLTTPILTSFNQHLNQVALALTSAHNPFHTLVGDVLAFGGPIAGAASGLVGFTANLTQTAAAMGGFRVAATALTTFMMGPWALAFAAGALAIGIVAGHMFEQKTNAQQLSAAQQQLKTDTDALKVSQDGLAKSQLDLTGAGLNVEEAQKNYNDAVAQYGPNSLEARQAAYNLATAHDAYKDAVNRVKDAQQQLQDKEHEIAKDQTLINHLQNIKGELDNVTRGADGAVTAIGNLNTQQLSPTAQKIVKTGQGIGGNKIDLSPLVKKASGGPVQAGKPYIVGDNPDGSLNNTSELFIPASSGTIVPSNQLQAALKGGGSSHTSINLNVNVGMYAGMPVEKRQIALELYKELMRAARAQGVQLPQVGAISPQ